MLTDILAFKDQGEGSWGVKGISVDKWDVRMCHQTHTNLVVIMVSLMQELTKMSDNISPISNNFFNELLFSSFKFF